MKEMLDRKKEQYNIAIRKEHRDKLLAQKRRRMETTPMSPLTIHQVEQQLHQQTSLTTINNLKSIVNQCSLCPSNQTIQMLFMQLTQYPDAILQLLVAISAIDKIPPQIISIYLHNAPILMSILNNSTCITTIQNIIYIISNISTQNAQIKALLTSSLFFDKINYLAMQNINNGSFINTILWMYSNILIKNKRSMKQSQHYSRHFMVELMKLLQHIRNQQKTVLRLVSLVVVLTNKEDRECLWAAGLHNIVQVLLTELASQLTDRTANILSVMLTILQQYKNIEHLNSAIRMVLSREEVYKHWSILEIVLQIVCLLKDGLVDQHLVDRLEHMWYSDQSVQFAYNLSRFLLYVCQTQVKIDYGVFLKRLMGLLCYENNDIVDGALKCLTVMVCQSNDMKGLKEMMMDAGIVERLLQLEMHQNTEIYERVKQILEDIDVHE